MSYNFLDSIQMINNRYSANVQYTLKTIIWYVCIYVKNKWEMISGR